MLPPSSPVTTNQSPGLAPLRVIGPWPVGWPSNVTEIGPANNSADDANAPGPVANLGVALTTSATSYVPGQPLDVYIADHQRPVRETLAIFARVCEAVNAAHLKGVIHRDLKPRNILIDEEGRPRVLDFGLAKVAGPEAMPSSRAQLVTTTGQFVGSLPWASPEQADGQPIDLFFTNGDAVSMHVLVAGAYEVLQDLNEKRLEDAVAQPSDLNELTFRGLTRLMEKLPPRHCSGRTTEGGVSGDLCGGIDPELFAQTPALQSRVPAAR